ncbi:MAG TPA: gluconate 2-dehydrogenase subunit 3 family protein [Opitutaceae bacterium]|nr:gluconate 2-dehydrogenase subunit 3 family protein [Opitutaceae bacterium]
MNLPESRRIDRRVALKWLATAAAAAAVQPHLGRAQAALPAAKGYGLDPLLNKTYAPGDLWPLTFTGEQRRAAAALCEIIIPREGDVPSARELGVHDFIDEWISAPYPDQQRDRQPVLEGLAWIDAESQRRFGRDFADLDQAQAAAICDDICHAPEARGELQKGAQFFSRFRNLCAGGFYSTPAGMKDVGYVGNTPQIEYHGPPPEVLRKLGLA